jgi:hypothetical protein
MISIRRLLLTVICLAGGGYFLFQGAGVASEALASDRWPQANGRIVTCDVVPRTGGFSSTSSEVKYEARIFYTYDVGGIHYEGNRLAVGHVSKTRTQPDAVARKYPAGRVVKVAYDPARPTAAVLEPGLNLSAALPALAGIALTLASFVFYILGRVSAGE